MEHGSGDKLTQAKSETTSGPDTVTTTKPDETSVSKPKPGRGGEPITVIDDETETVPITGPNGEPITVIDNETGHVPPVVPHVVRHVVPDDETQTKRETRRRFLPRTHLRKIYTEPGTDRVDYSRVFIFVHLFAILGITIVLLVLASQAARGRGAGTGGVGSECPVGARFVETEHEGCVCSTVNTLMIHPNLKLCTDQTPEDACRDVGDDYAYDGGVCAVEGTVLAGTGNNNPGTAETTPKAEKKSKAGLIVGVIIGIVAVVAILVVVITSVRRSKNKSDAPFQIASGVYGNTFVNEKEGDTQDMHDTMNYNFDKEA
ncbi:MAG: hypothetical protein MHMPM18_003363 [Marteilia pararefringens]